MNTKPAIFSFESNANIRAISIDGNPWFVATDVCSAIGIKHSASAMRALDADEKGVHSMHTPGGQQDFTIISESGLYTIILRCRDAVTPGTIPYRFRKWVTGEVLPQIRKTGRYVREELTSADKARMLAQEMTSNMLPAIMDALQVEQKKYTYPIKPGYMDHIHSAEGARMLTQKSNLWDLIRELQANGNDIDAAAAEMVVMCNYITGALQCFDQIRTHVAFIASKASGY